MINIGEVLETIKMINEEHLDIRTVTMGISLTDCARGGVADTCDAVYEKVCRYADRLVEVVCGIEGEYGIPIINKRISVTPVSLIGGMYEAADYVKIARSLDRAADTVGVNFIGGYSALVHKGYSNAERELVKSIPYALRETERLCSSVNVASTKSGINMDAVQEMGEVIIETARLTQERDCIGCAKLVVFANAVEDNPFMAGAFHGVGESECVINVGVSGPGAVLAAVKEAKELPFDDLAEMIKRKAFKITRMGQLIGTRASERLGVPFGIVDISLAPTPVVGDSVARILEEMGLERCGTHGTTAALALLNDAVKKGGAMASGHVGGLSGAFIPVSEDEGMIEAVKCGALSLEKLEAMTCVCSVGLDMIALDGNVSASTISAIIADEMAIGVINNKTTAARLIPALGKSAGDEVSYGGLLGNAPVMSVSEYSSDGFINRKGRIPAPIKALNN